MMDRLLFFPFLWVNQAKLQQQLTGKRVLITGASYGIGECLTEQLADTGVHLLLVARTAEKLQELQQRVTAKGGRADIFPCDLTDRDAVAALLAQLQLLGDIDIVVNNAGKSIRRSIFDALDRFHDFTRTMNLNYFGPVQLLLGLIPGLVARRGQVINISAINVLLAPMPLWASLTSTALPKLAFVSSARRRSWPAKQPR